MTDGTPAVVIAERPIDLSKLPPVLPVNVRRTDENGFPSKPLIDWETYTRDWYARGFEAVNENSKTHTRQLTVIRSELGAMSAEIQHLDETKVTATEAYAISGTAIQAKITDGTLATTAGVSNTLAAYTTVGQATAIANTTVTARIQSGEIVNNVVLASTLTGYTTPAQAYGQAVTAINVSLQNGAIQAGLTQEQLANISAVDGIELRYSVLGYIGGTYGGFVFTGIKRLNNEAATYLFEVYADMIVHGNLVVDGTVRHNEITGNAATQPAWAQGTNSAALGFNTRGGLIAVEVTRDADADVYTEQRPNSNPGSRAWGNLDLFVDGAHIKRVPQNSLTYYSYANFFAPGSGGPVSYTATMVSRVLNTTAIHLIQLAAGGYTFSASQDALSSGLITLKVTEYLR